MKNLKTPPRNINFNLIGIQQFPKGQKVALYFCPSLKKYFSLNYGKEGIELMESQFSVVEKLKQITESEEIYFNDGSSLIINEECSRPILNLYDILSEGKQDFEQFVLSSDKNFLKILEYSVNKFKKEPE